MEHNTWLICWRKTKIDLRSNRIGNTGAQQVALALKNNKLIEKLILAENSISKELQTHLEKEGKRLKFLVL
ncbi:unnamed protein product, partial [Adineta ricciae]